MNEKILDEEINAIHEFVDRVIKECNKTHPDNIPYHANVCVTCLVRVMIREVS